MPPELLPYMAAEACAASSVLSADFSRIVVLRAGTRACDVWGRASSRRACPRLRRPGKRQAAQLLHQRLHQRPHPQHQQNQTTACTSSS